MDAPALHGIDHVHVFVADRAAATDWYRRVLGLKPVPAYAGWATGGGPLTLADADETLHLALFESPARANRATIALRTDAMGFIAWRQHIAREAGATAEVVDHELSLSIYFRDPDGNPFEITTYEHEAARQILG